MPRSPTIHWKYVRLLRRFQVRRGPEKEFQNTFLNATSTLYWLARDFQIAGGAFFKIGYYYVDFETEEGN